MSSNILVLLELYLNTSNTNSFQDISVDSFVFMLESTAVCLENIWLVCLKCLELSVELNTGHVTLIVIECVCKYNVTLSCIEVGPLNGLFQFECHSFK